MNLSDLYGDFHFRVLNLRLSAQKICVICENWTTGFKIIF